MITGDDALDVEDKVYDNGNVETGEKITKNDAIQIIKHLRKIFPDNECLSTHPYLKRKGGELNDNYLKYIK